MRPMSLVSSHSTTEGSVAMVSSANIDTELRTTVLTSVDISLTTVSPLSDFRDSPSDGVRDNEKVANDVETNLMRTTVRGEVTDTTTRSTSAPVIPNQNHHNMMMKPAIPDISGQQSQPSAPSNESDIQDKSEEEQSIMEVRPQQNNPLQSLDVNNLLPTLQDQGFAQIISFLIFNSTKYFLLFQTKLFI